MPNVYTYKTTKGNAARSKLFYYIKVFLAPRGTGTEYSKYHNTKIIPFRIIPVSITNQNDRATG